MPPSAHVPRIPPEWDYRYRAIETAQWLIWADAALLDAETQARLEQPDRFFAEAVAHWFKQGRNRLAEVRLADARLAADLTGPLTVGRTGDPAPSVVLKQFGAWGAAGRMRALLRPGRAVRAWNQAFALLQRGLLTPRPLWLALPRRGGRWDASYLAVETVPVHVRLREALQALAAGRGVPMIGLPPDAGANGESTRRFIEALGRFVRRMHDAGVWHRDLSGGNILVLSPDNGVPKATPEGMLKAMPEGVSKATPGGAPVLPCARPERFVLIDVNRCRILAPGALGIARRLRDLERVALEAPLREIFYAAYAGGAYAEGTYAGGDAALGAARARYLKAAANYRHWRRTRNPALRFARKVLYYWLRAR